METAIENGRSAENDSDTDVFEVVNATFPACEHVHTQSLGPKYLLFMDGTRETNPTIATGLTDFSCDIFHLSGQLAKVNQIKHHTNKLIGVKFSPLNHNLLYTGSTDGTIQLWDLREPSRSVITLEGTTSTSDESTKPLSTFDTSPCDRLVAAGTDLQGGDAFIMFWDTRNANLLGGYWESHTDDITQVKFHPEDSNRLMSGSTDGLICIYDLSQTSEDDALQECLNTDEHVDDLEWFFDGKWKISCVTSIHDLQLWDSDGAEPYKRVDRKELAHNIKKSADNAYISKVHPLQKSLFVLAGSHGHEGMSLRSLHCCQQSLVPGWQFRQNVQRVRSSWINERDNLLLTGGEKGKLDIWRPDFSSVDFKSIRRK